VAGDLIHECGAPTPEFPQIADAKALFEALAETDEVKATGERS
jgi:hypothetical protein